MSPNPIPTDNHTTTKDKISEANVMEEKINEAKAAIDARAAMLRGMKNNGKDTVFVRFTRRPPNSNEPLAQ